ncbi:hypothetical protein CwatDRAFT_5708 [Crocosphaera watsonii WH 8501]|uniref:Uncharacterized protein n=1 Tax=Crocosphaera watsonii WH 8501 TaxID=165597 RepID=Q4C7N7_CROWT|nr:hypothetical protein CwatDRAFT_5708 [Crocosphaera watsonii WH 8501]
MTIITIHEFSTGIAVQGTPENWWSTRFTGYMNLTLAKVPAVLQNAISNRLFQVAEGSVREAVETARAAKQAHSDECFRNAIEGKFGQAK